MDPSEASQQVQDAVEAYVFDRVHPKDVQDLEVTVSYEDGDLSIEVYLVAPGYDEEKITREAVQKGFSLADRILK